jgi:hypothetical protein
MRKGKARWADINEVKMSVYIRSLPLVLEKFSVLGKTCRKLRGCCKRRRGRFEKMGEEVRVGCVRHKYALTIDSHEDS